MEEITECRICHNRELISYLNLGDLAMTGVFPKTKSQKVTSGPIELVQCSSETGCGLVQLKQTYNLDEMYGHNYGYRSGLNQSMVQHLHSVVDNILRTQVLRTEDVILDIGSNDSTLLQRYPANFKNLIGIDPTGVKFKKYYPEHIRLVPTFFSEKAFRSIFPHQNAKVVTSFSMFYDLPNPSEFVGEISKILADDGFWIFEQSYLPSMLATNSFDTICHEHLEYYALKQVHWMLERAQMKIHSVEMNRANGGSFRVTARKLKAGESSIPSKDVRDLLEKEKEYLSPSAIEHFKKRVRESQDLLVRFLTSMRAEDKLVIGYGASTKGNVLLQHYQITESLIPFIAEVNEEKWGAFTPGTLIPIIEETKANQMNPAAKVILPWHFKEFFLEKEKFYLEKGGQLVFPLPDFEILTIENMNDHLKRN